LSLVGGNRPSTSDRDRVRVGGTLKGGGFIANSSVGVRLNVFTYGINEKINSIRINGFGEGNSDGGRVISIVPSSVAGVEGGGGEGRNDPSLSDLS